MISLGRLGKKKTMLLVLGLAVLGTGLFGVPKVLAGVCWNGLQCDTGYFSGQGAVNGDYPSEYDDVLVGGIPGNVNDAPSFINMVNSYLQCTSIDQPNSALRAQSNHNSVGAAFFVVTMLGMPLKTPKNQACVHFTEWKNLVNDYAEAGLINFHLSMSQANTTDLNSYYAPDWGGDVAYTRGAQNGSAIVFYAPDHSGISYIIRRECGNPIGTVKSLDKVNKAYGNVSAAIGPNDATPNIDTTKNSNCEVISGHAFDPSVPSYAVKVTISFSIGGQIETYASTQGDHLYQANTPDNVRNSTSPVVVTAVGTAANGSQFALANSPITIGPCLTITVRCVDARTTPTTPDPNLPYSIRATVQYGNATQAEIVRSQPDFRFFVTVRGPNGPRIAYDNQNVPGATRSGSQIFVQIDNIPPNGSAGTYSIGWGVVGSFGSVSCGASSPGDQEPPIFVSLNKPYVAVHGADVNVGEAMSPTDAPQCSMPVNSAASIVGWNVDMSKGDYRGAGADYAGYAMNHIQEFTTAQGSAGLPREPSGLAFANNEIPNGDLNPNIGLYGGKYAGSGCIGNYFSHANASNTTAGPVLMSTLPNFPTNGDVPNGAHLIYYIDGDLLVDSNVRFSTTYGGTSEIPTFAVVVKGNIYIRPSISQLDGFYIAQPVDANSTKGVIFTCAPSDFASDKDNLLKGTLYDACNKALTVNGAFLGRQVWLLRTSGTVTTTPAEVFNYVPDVWLTAPFGNGINTDYGDYDAISSLPPVL